jgi:hypothetical protein
MSGHGVHNGMHKGCTKVHDGSALSVSLPVGETRRALAESTEHTEHTEHTEQKVRQGATETAVAAQ